MASLSGALPLGAYPGPTWPGAYMAPTTFSSCSATLSTFHSVPAMYLEATPLVYTGPSAAIWATPFVSTPFVSFPTPTPAVAEAATEGETVAADGDRSVEKGSVEEESPSSPLHSEDALRTAKIEGQQHLEHLRKHNVLDIVRPIIIRATSIKDPPPSKPYKTLHIIRHGQGYHNLLGDLFRNWGKKVDATGNPNQDPKGNPYMFPEVLDPPLTELGRQQAKALQPRAHALNPTLVVVSPLLRATQTAVIAFQHLYGNANVRWVAADLVRETFGVHVCDKRRPASEAKADFPLVDYSMVEEEDTQWTSQEREGPRSNSDRCYEFMLWLRNQPEDEVVIGAHSSVVFSLMNTVIKCPEELSTWFLTGEMRSVRVTYEDQA